MSEILTAETMWRLPRVGRPVPLPGRAACILPVARDLGPEGKDVRLWLQPLEGAARPLTAEGVESRAPAVDAAGETLAFLRAPGEDGAGARHADVAQVHRLPLGGGEAERLTDLPFGAEAPRFLPDGRVLLLSRVFAEAPDLEATAARKAERAEDSTDVRVSESRVFRYWDRWLTEGLVHHLLLLDPSSGRLDDLTPDWTRWLPFDDPGGGLDVRPDGGELAFTAALCDPPHDPLRFGIYLLELPAPGEAPRARPRLLAPEDETGHARQPRYGAGGERLVHGMQREHDFYADRQRLVLRRGGARRVLTEAWDRSAGAWAHDPSAPGRLWIVAEDEGREALCALDLDAAWDDPASHPPRVVARGGTLGVPVPDGERVWCVHQALDAPPELAVVELDPARVGEEVVAPRRVSRFTEEVMADLRLGAVRERVFPGADAEPVQMFLVDPPGGAASDREPAAEPPPLVHLVHGGPHGAFGDAWHWRWNAQVVAAAGYRVALVNFHGSTGWGDAFTRSILGRWGDLPARDLEAATDLLVAEELVDPARMALAGGSYGGYLVSWMAGQTDRYACLINHAGVCDLQTQWATDITQGRERSLGGAPWSDPEPMDRWSPMRHSAGFASPMLVLHGERDYRVPYVEGLQIYNAYKARGLPARLAVYPGENHWILSRANSLHWYGEVLDWLARWLGGDGA